MHEKKGNENGRYTDRHKPFVADVTRRMKNKSIRRKFVVKLLDQRFERRPLKPQTQAWRCDIPEVPDRSAMPNRQLPFCAWYHWDAPCHALLGSEFNVATLSVERLRLNRKYQRSLSPNERIRSKTVSQT